MRSTSFNLFSGYAYPINLCIGRNRRRRFSDLWMRRFFIVVRGTMSFAILHVLIMFSSHASAQLQPRAPENDNGPSRPPPWVYPAPRPLPVAPAILRSRAVARTIYQYSPFTKLGITAQQGFDRTPAPEWSWGDGSSKNFGETSKVWMQPGTFYGRVTGFRGGVRVVRSFRTEVVENPVQTGSTNCAIRADKRVMCWGRNDLGQVGDNTRIERLTPRLVIGLSNAISIATSTIATCALKADRSIACWGYRRAMGNGAVSDQLVAKTVSGLTDIRSLAGVAEHFCVVKGDGTVLCWGTNSYGALGEGAPPTVLALPTSVSGVTGAITLALSTTRSCALKTDGTAVCWGSDPIAMPTDTMTSAEVDAAVALKTVSSPSEAVAIAAGGSHTCFLKMDGTVHCRGSNSWGMLGESPDLYKRDEVASVPGVSGILAISATSNSTCGLKANSTVLCWGYNNGWALNPASSDLGLPPTVISGLSGVTAVSTTGSHACALATTGRLICWGNNESGRLGTGTKSFRSPPVPVSGGAVFWK